jgi:hypothetical protein
MTTTPSPAAARTFHLDGSIVEGPATARHPSFETRTREGKIEIRALALRRLGMQRCSRRGDHPK